MCISICYCLSTTTGKHEVVRCLHLYINSPEGDSHKCRYVFGKSNTPSRIYPRWHGFPKWQTTFVLFQTKQGTYTPQFTQYFHSWKFLFKFSNRFITDIIYEKIFESRAWYESIFHWDGMPTHCRTSSFPVPCPMRVSSIPVIKRIHKFAHIP